MCVTTSRDVMTELAWFLRGEAGKRGGRNISVSGPIGGDAGVWLRRCDEKGTE